MAAEGVVVRGSSIFHVSDRHGIRLLLIYRKGIKGDLSAAEKKVLRALNEKW